MSERYRCEECGKSTAGRTPVGGDGTFHFPRRHNITVRGVSVVCPGVFDEADWVPQIDNQLKDTE